MSLIAKDLPTLVFMLLPGFLSAGIFYTLTAHPKSTEFERLIQALIFTTILRLLTNTVRWAMVGLGSASSRPLGSWTEDVDFGWSVILSVLVGLAFAVSTNKNFFQKILQAWGWTTRSSYPSEWYGAFASERRWIILHLKDGRRLYGWPSIYPDQPDKGHFSIDRPEWLLDNGARAPLDRVDRFLIPASNVEMVEFMRPEDEVTQDPVSIKEAEDLLLNAQKGATDGIAISGPGTRPAGETEER